MGNYNFDLVLEEKNTMSIINSWIERGTYVLEFGPANGRLTKYLSQEKDCKVTIVEIDEDDGKEAELYAQNALIGHEKGDINKYFWCELDEKYDYIIFADVLEHLPNPGEVLKRCKEKLKPDGSILISIPNLSHNSVLIELLNDRFFYQKTGLLDSTHIHFFTYYSFLDMIEKNGYSVEDIDYVYSRVGWNEIKNNYTDIPKDLEKIIRKRRFGSVYQFVAKIQALDETYSKKKLDNTERYIDYSDDEITCFYWKDINKTEEYSKKSVQYKEDGLSHMFSFEIASNVEKIRIDPMEERCVLKFEEIVIYHSNVEKTRASIIDTNASIYGDEVYFFDTKDPWIVIELPTNEIIQKVEVSFKVLGSRMDDGFVEMCASLNSTKYGIDKKTKDRLFELEKQQEDKKKYIVRLENEREELKEYTNRLEHNELEFKTYTERLEKEQLEYKKYIERLEKNQEEFKSYIQRLESEKAAKDEEIASLSSSKEALEEILRKRKGIFGFNRDKK